ncbi:MAG TPA: hypothetical protein VGN21_14830 [Stellaceae bacterium]
MRRFWITPLGIIASLVSLAAITQQLRSVIDVFELADPTGNFGIYFFLGGLAANLAVIFVAVCVLLPPSRSNVRLGFAAIAFVPSLLEAIGVLPCFLSARPGALCGVGFVFVSYVSVPVVLLAAIGFVATAQYRAVKVAGMSLTVTFIGIAAAAHALLAPSHPDQCANFAEVTKRSNCLKAFAERGRDETLCRSIEFRTTRFTCLREIAVEKRQPALCDEIAEAGPIAAYESPAVLFRDTCFQNLAYAMHDRSQCAKVADAPLRASCEAHNP